VTFTEMIVKKESLNKYETFMELIVLFS
jgi:hypothetical protein